MWASIVLAVFCTMMFVSAAPLYVQSPPRTCGLPHGEWLWADLIVFIEMQLLMYSE